MLEHKIHLSYWGAMKTFDAWWGKYKTKRKKKQPKTATESAGVRAAKHCVSEREQRDGIQSCKHTHACMHTQTPAHKSSPRNTNTQQSSERAEANHDLQCIPTKSHSGRMPVVLSASGRAIAGAKKPADFCVIVPPYTSSGATEWYQVNNNVDFFCWLRANRICSCIPCKTIV